MDFNLEIGLILLEELALIALPAIAAALFGAARGIRSPVLLVGLALTASGTAAMLVFWGFYAEPLIGKTLAYLVVFGAAAAIVSLWFEGRGRTALRELATPFSLWVLASFFVVFLGFLHGSSLEVLELASHRFSHMLPTDSEIPRFFAEWFYQHGHAGPPPQFPGDWLASDRPPLQIAYTLALRPFGWDGRSLHYQLLAVALQQLWVPAVWALLRAARMSRRGAGLVLVAAMVSDIAIIHGFFVWPKLIAAAFLLAAAAIVFSPEWRRWTRDPRVGALFAALCALAMLCHGSSVFLLIPLLIFAALRALPDWRWIALALAAALLLLAPWSAYQRFADPPGNRLIKWQLGGSLEIDKRGSLQTILDGYRKEGLSGSLENKWHNLTTMVGAGEVSGGISNAAEEIGEGHLGEALETLRIMRFYALLPCLGFLLLGLLAMALRSLLDRGGERGPEWAFALTGAGLCLAVCLFWALVMFGNPISETVIHQGTLAVPLLAICVCVAGAYASLPCFATILVAANGLFVLALYTPVVTPPPGTSYSAVAATLAALALAGFCWISLRTPWVTAEGEYTAAC
ncbi:MAG: hypothetical protein WB507_13145 [Solirubrobacterales bacterium]